MRVTSPALGEPMTVEIQLQSTLTFPECRHQADEAMPTDACQFFYECRGCGAILRPKAGDCCVFCSYGTVPCPPIQAQSSCCDSKTERP
jgi:hypothetical protein